MLPETPQDRMEKFASVYNDMINFPTTVDVAEELKISIHRVRGRASELRTLRAAGNRAIPEVIIRHAAERTVSKHMSIEAIPDAEEPIDELIARAIVHNNKQIAHHDAKKIVDIDIFCQGPIGVAGLPDQHLNNTGTRLDLAMKHAELIQNTEGLYAIAVGDWLDNFIIGRLERERRADIMPHSDTNRIQEHYVSLIADKLVAAIGGNHNDWPEMLGGHDILGDLMRRLNKGGIYDADEIRVRLNLPGGASFTHLVRHIFPGHSKYNIAHGVLAWMLDRWQGEDVFWGGHIHSAAHTEIEREYMGDTRVVHGVQLSTYKVLDGYAIKRGFRKNSPFIAPMVLHLPETGKTVFFSDLEEGVEYLKFVRAEYDKKKRASVFA